jgi:hypothetical protein
MKRELTAEQQAKRDERKAKFKSLWKQVAAMPELDRIQMSNRLGFVTCEGHTLSIGNMMLVALQCPNASVLGGFRQWIKHGRAVRKGQHGSMIWVPTGGRKNDAPLDGGTSASAVVDGQPAGDNDTRFIIGTLFDISQTDEIQTDNPIAVVSPEIAQAFGMIALPNVRVPVQDETVIA